VIGAVFEECFFESLLMGCLDDNTDRAKSVANGCSVGGENVAREFVQSAEKRAGLEVDVFVTLFESIQFFENGDRDDNIMLFKVPQAAGIVKNDICVEHKQLRLYSRRTIRHLVLPDRYSPFTGTAIPFGDRMLTGVAETVNDSADRRR
jgi:hypothetical protein